MKLFGTSLIILFLWASEVCGQITKADTATHPSRVSDEGLRERIGKDLTLRNSSMRTSLVKWFATEEGYYGTYAQGQTEYISFYDLTGNFIQTFKKSDWKKAPASFRASYSLSDYSAQKVSTYWESVDRKGYYLELKDDKGNLTGIWANEKGDFHRTWPKAKMKN